MKLPLLALALLPLAACNIEAGNNTLPSNGLRAFEGERCKVQLRRDMLGAETALPIPPTTDAYNGARVSIAGVLDDVGHNGVVLVSEGRDIWIPMEAILMVDFGPGRALLPTASKAAPLAIEDAAQAAAPR